VILKKIYRKSRWLHKYLGLILVLFLMWMSVSGIVLNHPEWVAGVSVPSWMVPPSYKTDNWNRSSLIGLRYLPDNPNLYYIYGKKGVWKTEDGGRTFEPLDNGFPKSRYYLKTNYLFLWTKENPFLLAATDGGLFKAHLKTERWQRIPLGDPSEKVKKILRVGKELIVFTESNVYRAPFPSENLKFEPLIVARNEPEQRVTLVKLFFDLHDGKVLGLAGKLWIDVMGIILFFLSFTGFYIWFNPWRWRKRQRRFNQIASIEKIKRVRFLLKYHLKLGIYVAFFFLIMGATAFFMRPPFLAAIATGTIPAKYYPGKLSQNPWEEKIHTALYDSLRNRILISATDGLWQGKADFSEPFEKTNYRVPIFVMGPTYFETTDEQKYLIGSFSGLFLLDPDKNTSVDLISGTPVGEFSVIRPGKWMVTGYFTLPDGRQYITTHDSGLHALQNDEKNFTFRLPERMNSEYTLSLWNFMFELHNGRIFQDLIGSWYILIAPLGSLLFLIITLSGIFDWFCIKMRKESKKKNKPDFRYQKSLQNSDN